MWLLQEIHYVPHANTAPGIDGVAYYRILGRGVANDIVVVSESIVARPWGGAVKELAFPPADTLSEFCASINTAVPCGRLSWRQRR